MFIHTSNLVTPANFTEATRVLGKRTNAKGFADNTIVYLDYKSLSPARGMKSLLVHGGTAEQPVRIYVESGMNTVEILSGHVEIASESGHGNSVKAHGGTHVTIEADADRKVTVEGEGTVTFKTNDVKHRLRDFTSKGIEVRVSVAA